MFMKNKMKWFGIIAVVAVIGFSMTACGGGGSKLSGTYESSDGYTSLTFKGNQITMMRDGKVITESAYEIKDGKICFTSGGSPIEMDYKLEGKTLTYGASKLTKK